MLRLPSVFLFVIYSSEVIALWWSLETSLQQDPNAVCKKTQSFFRTKQDLCNHKPELISTVLEGMDVSVDECQWQFRNRKWNCSTSKNSIKRIIRFDYRETAFIYAITSAGVTFSVTRACSMGHLQQCGCRKVTPPAQQVPSNNVISSYPRNDYPATDNHLPNQAFPIGENDQFEWGGCSDNIDRGYEISQQLLKEGRSNDGRSMIFKHNNEAGRLAVKLFMQRECKCYGLSGSCSVKTCWKKMPHFRDVGDRLKTRFDSAVKVIISNKGDELIKEGETIKPPTELDLVYTTDSPDFCKVSSYYGTHGTAGRQCNETYQGVGGCDLLCCTRRARMKKVVITENCQCRFLWCCTVKCKKCRREQEVFTCE